MDWSVFVIVVVVVFFSSFVRYLVDAIAAFSVIPVSRDLFLQPFFVSLGCCCWFFIPSYQILSFVRNTCIFILTLLFMHTFTHTHTQKDFVLYLFSSIFLYIFDIVFSSVGNRWQNKKKNEKYAYIVFAMCNRKTFFSFRKRMCFL